MVKPELISAGKYDEVTRLCREAVMASLGFELRHLGVNEPDESAALRDAQKMEALFGFALKKGNSSHFAGIGFEFMKTRYLAKRTHRHIDLECRPGRRLFCGQGHRDASRDRKTRRLWNLDRGLPEFGDWRVRAALGKEIT